MDVNLVLFKKNGTKRNFSLPGTVTIIGRRQDCDLCIPLMVVSRKHCELDANAGAIKIRDLGSRNGTFLNGQRIDEAQLNPGDQISVGPVRFALQVNGEPADDSAILHPPDRVSKLEKEVAAQAGAFAGLDDLDEVDTMPGHNVEEMLDNWAEEASPQ